MSVISLEAASLNSHQKRRLVSEFTEAPVRIMNLPKEFFYVFLAEKTKTLPWPPTKPSGGRPYSWKNFRKRDGLRTILILNTGNCSSLSAAPATLRSIEMRNNTLLILALKHQKESGY